MFIAPASLARTYRHALLAIALPLGACATSVGPDVDETGDAGAAVAALTGHAPAADTRALRALHRNRACRHDPRVRLGLVSAEICVGAELFFRETFGGNGRTCNSCHPAAHDFTLDADLIASMPDDDPLFVAERDPELAALEQPELMRRFGLFTVNADGFEDPAHKFVLRSVPHMLSMTTSMDIPPSEEGAPTTIDGTTAPPNQRTGWSGDGAPGNGELRDFTDGAITQHATRSLHRRPGVDFVLPTDAERDAIAAFTLELGRKRDIEIEHVSLSDPGAERGRLSFVSGAAQECSQCHGDAGANMVVTDEELGISFTANFSFEVGTERARIPELDAHGIPIDGGFGLRPSDLGDDGIPDVFGNGAFNTPPLIEAADTGPFFHTNAAETIEDAIRFYTTDEFGDSLSGAPAQTRPNGGPFVLTEDEIADLGRFLRVLNAALNCQIAIRRLDGAARINAEFGNRHIAIERGLLELTMHDLEDALEDLDAVADLNTDVQAKLEYALNALRRGSHTGSQTQRKAKIEAARTLASAANAALGSGMSYDIGAGHLLF
jgi:cytochrome c peroxidase